MEIKACICSKSGSVAVSTVETPDFSLLFCPRCDRKVRRPTKAEAIEAWNKPEQESAD